MLKALLNPTFNEEVSEECSELEKYGFKSITGINFLDYLTTRDEEFLKTLRKSTAAPASIYIHHLDFERIKKLIVNTITELARNKCPLQISKGINSPKAPYSTLLKDLNKSLLKIESLESLVLIWKKIREHGKFKKPETLLSIISETKS